MKGLSKGRYDETFAGEDVEAWSSQELKHLEEWNFSSPSLTQPGGNQYHPETHPHIHPTHG